MPGGTLVSIETIHIDIDIHLEWPRLGIHEEECDIVWREVEVSTYLQRKCRILFGNNASGGRLYPIILIEKTRVCKLIGCPVYDGTERQV